MRKLRFGAAAVLTAVALTGVFASNALAFPTKTVSCDGCHSGVNVAVTVTLASTVGTTATYNASAPGAGAIAVFDGATKVATIVGATGQFSVPTGKTYSVFAVQGPTTGDGIGTTSVSPAAVVPALDLTAPSTLSNAAASYTAVANITLTATDNLGGSGVASTYYVLDSGTQVQGAAVSVTALGAHTLEFWSVDAAGNIEARKAASFAITAPAVVVRTRVLVSNPVAKPVIYRGKAAAIYGFLKTRHAAGTYPVRIYKWRYVGGKWKAYGFVNAKASNYSSYTKYVASVKFPYAGKWRVRAYTPVDALHLATWSAGYDVVIVK